MEVIARHIDPLTSDLDERALDELDVPELLARDLPVVNVDPRLVRVAAFLPLLALLFLRILFHGCRLSSMMVLALFVI